MNSREVDVNAEERELFPAALALVSRHVPVVFHDGDKYEGHGGTVDAYFWSGSAIFVPEKDRIAWKLLHEMGHYVAENLRGGRNLGEPNYGLYRRNGQPHESRACRVQLYLQERIGSSKNAIQYRHMDMNIPGSVGRAIERGKLDYFAFCGGPV